MGIMQWLARKILPPALFNGGQLTRDGAAVADPQEMARREEEKRRLETRLAAISAEAQMHERLLR